MKEFEMINAKESLERKINFHPGRSNLSATIYIPVDCSNSCAFCSSKELYSGNINVSDILSKVSLLANSIVEEIVITGGEPMESIEILELIVTKLKNKRIYINTSLINKNLVEFIELVNERDCIKGVNISRHAGNYENDCKVLCNIAEDSVMNYIKKPVKINVVIPYRTELSEKFVEDVLTRWSVLLNHKDIHVTFRENFNSITLSELHSMQDEKIFALNRLGNYVGHTMCNVCDTVHFYSEKHEIMYSLHRGIATTSIAFGDNIEVNDIILFPDGTLSYDWDKKVEHYEEFLKAFRIRKDQNLSLSERLELLKGKNTMENTKPKLSEKRNTDTTCGVSSGISCASRKESNRTKVVRGTLGSCHSSMCGFSRNSRC